jgi:hypothetical protein
MYISSIWVMWPNMDRILKAKHSKVGKDNDENPNSEFMRDDASSTSFLSSHYYLHSAYFYSNVTLSLLLVMDGLKNGCAGLLASGIECTVFCNRG